MAVHSNSSDRLPESVMNACIVNSTNFVADGAVIAVNKVNSESIADEFKTGLHLTNTISQTILKRLLEQIITPYGSFVELEDKIAVDDSLEHTPNHTVSRTHERPPGSRVRSLSIRDATHTTVVSPTRCVAKTTKVG